MLAFHLFYKTLILNMVLLTNGLTALLYLNSIILLILSYHIFRNWKEKKIKAGLAFSLLMAASCAWAFTAAIESAATTLEAKILWSQLSYVGIVSVAPLWLIFTLQYVQARESLVRTVSNLVWIVPVIILAFVFTNDSHHLLWTKIELISSNIADGVIYRRGPVFIVNAVYIYLLLFLGSFILARYLLKTSGERKKQIIALLLAMFAPMAANIIYLIAAPRSLLSIDLTPVAMLITGLVILLSLFRYRFFSLLPLAQEQFFANYKNAIIITDLNNVVLAVNPAARKLLGEQLSVGLDLTNYIDSKKFNLASLIRQEGRTVMQDSVNKFWFEINVSLFTDEHGHKIGKIIAFADISQLKQSEKEIADAKIYCETIINFLPQATVVTDINGRVTFWNQAMETLTSVKSEEVLGQDSSTISKIFYSEPRQILLDIVLKPEIEPQLKQFYTNYKKEGETISAQSVTEKLRKEKTYLELKAKPIKDLEGNIIGAIETVSVITNSHVLEAQLKEKVDELSKLNALMTNRELKMVELKQELEALKSGQQQPQQ